MNLQRGDGILGKWGSVDVLAGQQISGQSSLMDLSGGGCRPRICWLVVVLFALVATSLVASFGTTEAYADEGSFERPTPQGLKLVDESLVSEPEREWYGWQVLIADAASVAVFGLALALESDGFGYASVGLFAVAAPGVHVAHGRWPQGLLSFGLRTALPFAGFFIGGTASNRIDLGVLEHAFLGGIIGMAIASAVDLAVLSWKPVRQESTAWVPVVAPTEGGLTAGLAATF